MEINDYLGLIRNRLKTLVLIPLLSAALAVGFTLLRYEQSYVAVATVSVSTVVGLPGSQFSGAQGASLLLESFTAVSRSPAVLREVSEATGVPVVDLTRPGAVDVEPVGDSSLIRVAARSTNQSKAMAIATELASDALESLLGPQTELASRLVEEAEASLQEAESDIESFIGESATAVGPSEYELRVREISSLREAAARAEAAGRVQEGNNLTDAARQRAAELAESAGELTRFDSLWQLHQRALERLGDAVSNRERVRALLAASSDGALVVPESVVGDSLLVELVRSALGGAGAGALVAVLAVLVLEMASGAPRRKPGPAADRSDAPEVEETDPPA